MGKTGCFESTFCAHMSCELRQNGNAAAETLRVLSLPIVRPAGIIPRSQRREVGQEGGAARGGGSHVTVWEAEGFRSTEGLPSDRSEPPFPAQGPGRQAQGVGGRARRAPLPPGLSLSPQHLPLPSGPVQTLSRTERPVLIENLLKKKKMRLPFHFARCALVVVVFLEVLLSLPQI